MDDSKLSKEPSFRKTGLESPITEIALAIQAHKDGKHYASGSAVIIGQNIAITAQHVIDDFIKHFEDGPLECSDSDEFACTFHLQLFQVLDNGNSGQVWNVTRLWSCNYTDIAFLLLSPTTQEALNHKWLMPKLDLVPPNIGERVSCFGYRKPNITRDDNKIEWRVDTRTSIGEVREVHDVQRDSVRLNFPCFQTNARYDGAMSGGPVFNSSGKLCGIICSNLPPSADGEEHTSYVTSIWPLMGLKIDIDREGHSKGVKYPILELARDGFIDAKGWERIILKPGENEGDLQVGFKKA